MRITAQDLLRFELIDGVIPEPPGGAHEDRVAAAQALKSALLDQLDGLDVAYGRPPSLDAERLVQDRFTRYRRMGVFAEPAAAERGSG
jgi:acetyl-CoA carboxylase alpha subunit